MMTEEGVTISTPIYFRISAEHSKFILNTFREKKRQQLLEMGITMSAQPVAGTSLQVQTASSVMSPVEHQLGMNEENLRLHLFSRQGINDKLLTKLQVVLGISLVSKEEVMEAATLWISHLYDDQQTTKEADKTSKVTGPSKTRVSRSKTKASV